MDLSCAAIQVHIVDMCLNVFVVVLLPVISVVSFVFHDGLNLLLSMCREDFFPFRLPASRLPPNYVLWPAGHQG